MKESIATVIIAIILTLAIVILTSTAMTYRHHEKMAEMGYVEVSYPGSSWTHWERQK